MEKEMSEFASEFCNFHSPSTPVNTMWMDIKRKCNKVITTHVPSKYTSTRFSQPWCNREIRRRSRRKKLAHMRAKRTQGTNDWDRFRKVQVENQKACKNAYNTFVNSMVDEDNENCKRLYSFIKSKKCDGSSVSPLRCEGVLHSSPKDKAEILNTQLSSLFTSDLTSAKPIVKPHQTKLWRRMGCWNFWRTSTRTKLLRQPISTDLLSFEHPLVLLFCFRSASLLSPLADLGRFLKLKHKDRAGVRATNQITRYKTPLECVGNGVPQVDDFSNCLLSPQVQFYVRSGWISPNYWSLEWSKVQT